MEPVARYAILRSRSAATEEEEEEEEVGRTALVSAVAGTAILLSLLVPSDHPSTIGDRARLRSSSAIFRFLQTAPTSVSSLGVSVSRNGRSGRGNGGREV